MKKFKYTLIEQNPPEGYRWIRTGETYLHGDISFHHEYNWFEPVPINFIGQKCIVNSPRRSICDNHYSGIIRKL